ncbi:hypothetical protein [Pontibacter burrus]|uniref:Uncharacterized protein n=1 Tax=Pontibacter burrus TaxID=2704466 RepID=A0A6B3M0E5_9BACT|nr:hypothetical protein [Pontibacter burrus]NEM99328.1 hypothetical protein [Pontibacter burrus]
MVTVINYEKRNSGSENEFNALILQGEIEMVQSKVSGRFYATAKQCSISCTFNDIMCQGLIGKTLPGTIEKMECEEYEYIIPGTGETVMLNYTYYYNPTDRTMEQEVFQLKSEA